MTTNKQKYFINNCRHDLFEKLFNILQREMSYLSPEFICNNSPYNNDKQTSGVCYLNVVALRPHPFIK